MDRNVAYLATAAVTSLLVGVVQGGYPVGSAHQSPGRTPDSRELEPVKRLALEEAPPRASAQRLALEEAPPRASAQRLALEEAPPRASAQRRVGGDWMPLRIRRDQERIRRLEQSRSGLFQASEATARRGSQLAYQVADLEETVAQLQRQVSILEALLRAGERFAEPMPITWGAFGAGQQAGEANAWENLGIQLLNLGWFQKANEAFYRALSLSPMDPNLHYNLGVLADRILGEPGRALYHFRSFVALAPEDPDAPTVAGWVKQRERD